MAELFESRWEHQHDFIFEQQAKFSAGMDALRQQTESNERQIATNSGKNEKLAEVCQSLAYHIERLTEAMKQTGDQLNALIEIAE